MRISLDWLKDFADFLEKDPRAIAERLTSSVAEVEEIEALDAHLTGCCVGKVLSISRHPNADKLHLCDVRTDRGVKRVVCGGTNLREGMRVAFAHAGARVKTEKGELLELTKAKIRGEESDGMICASVELDLASRFPPRPDQGARPVIDLGEGNEGVGKPLAAHLGMDDTVFHVDNHAITHRADLFSHKGFARECVALGLARWKKRKPEREPTFPRTPLPFTFKLDAPKAVPRYLGCALAIEGLGRTPDWMVRRLEAVGMRSVSLPVDITNYVTVETGAPLHSFDSGDFRGAVHFRTAREGETIVTLDHVSRTLNGGALVLSDDEGIFDLMGIMGGLRSSTKGGTRAVYLHAASVDPVAIRRTIIATGHRTDAATIYEKGVPPVVAEEGFFRALALFLELVPGARITSRLASWGKNGRGKPIMLPMDRVRSMLGVEIGGREMRKILSGLEFETKARREALRPFDRAQDRQGSGQAGGGKQEAMEVIPPLHRLGDITGEHDLIEEIARIYGYDRIEPRLPDAPMRLPARDRRMHVMRESLRENGGIETVPLSFVSPDLLSRARMDGTDVLRVSNPLGEELSLFQPSVLPRLLEHAAQERKHWEDGLLTFAVGRVFRGIRERAELGLLSCVRSETDLRLDPFLRAKNVLFTALRNAGYDAALVPADAILPFAHPGRAADIVVQEKAIGSLFEVHPTVRARFDLPARAAAAIVSLSELFALAPRTTLALAVPAFPAVRYDITVDCDHARAAGTLLRAIRATSDLLESTDIIDIFGAAAPAGGRYKLTIRCTYRAGDRTLTEEETRREFARVERLVGAVQGS